MTATVPAHLVVLAQWQYRQSDYWYMFNNLLIINLLLKNMSCLSLANIIQITSRLINLAFKPYS